jgi:rod shape-determining protein MreC
VPRWVKPTVAVLLILYLAAQVLSLSFRKKPTLRLPERWVVALTVPPQQAVSATVGWMGDTWDRYLALVGMSRRVEGLQGERDELARKLVESKEVDLENARLRQLLELGQRSEVHLMAARRLASGASAYERTIRVSRGKRDGVRPGAAVLHPRGVVGQVLEAFPAVSDVLLLVDLVSAVDVIGQRSRARGILRGAHMDELKFEYLSKKEDVQVGDEVITSGLDGVYPKGIPVGVVTSVEAEPEGLFREATVRPRVDFTQLEEVGIVTGGKE